LPDGRTSSKRLPALATELRAKHSGTVRIVTKDLATATAAQDLFDELTDITIDVLVNNAGFGDRGHLVELPLQRQIEMVQLNVLTL
jgi:uncharacterized protein